MISGTLSGAVNMTTMANILVCDDDREIVDAIEIYLKNDGYSVLKAYNGMDALGIISETEVHLVIMDVMMPKLDGIQATLKIRDEGFSGVSVVRCARWQSRHGQKFRLPRLLAPNGGRERVPD